MKFSRMSWEAKQLYRAIDCNVKYMLLYGYAYIY